MAAQGRSQAQERDRSAGSEVADLQARRDGAQ
jgi:hypothetical protein